MRLLLATLLTAAAPLLAADALYENNFEQAPLGKLPPDVMVLTGGFTVAEEAGAKFLELPGSPLDTFGALFGPALPGDATVTARIFGTRQGRKFPAFGISLNGVGGYRLQVSPGKKALEIFQGDESKASVPFDWQSGAWTTLRLTIHKTADGCLLEGKAWHAPDPEPAAPTLCLEEKTTPPPGRAGLWGSPYAGTPIRFDDLRVEAVAK